MLGWVIAGHDYYAQDMLDAIEKRFGPQPQCYAVNFWQGLSTNMLSRMLCDALYKCDSGDGVIFLTDKTGAAPYRTAAQLSHTHSHCEVISGVTLPLLCAFHDQREELTSEAFRQLIVEQGGPEVTSLWHQQQKNPPFQLRHHY